MFPISENDLEDKPSPCICGHHMFYRGNRACTKFTRFKHIVIVQVMNRVEWAWYRHGTFNLL